jgi:hypothetical protein
MQKVNGVGNVNRNATCKCSGTRKLENVLIQHVTGAKKFLVPQFLRISQMLRTRIGENFAVETG